MPSWGATDRNSLWSVHGDPLGEIFNPPVSDTVLREHLWFWQPGSEATLKSTKQLVHNYLTSVGRASNLILNVGPDSTGAIPPVDVARYEEMGKAVGCLFSKPIALRASAPARMNRTSGAMEPATVLTTPLALAPGANYSLVLREDLTSGQLIGNYSVQCLGANAADTWTACPLGSLGATIPGAPLAAGVGHKR